MQGRKPKPLEDRVRDGTYNPRLHGPLDGHKFLIANPLQRDPPECLCPYARDVWNRLYETVTRNGNVTENERDLFMAYCDAVGTFERATDEIKREGLFVEKIRNKGGPKRKAFSDLNPPQIVDTDIPSKWERVKRNAMVDMRSLAKLLGLTTVDRIKVIRPKTKQEQEADAGGKSPNARPKSAIDKLAATG